MGYQRQASQVATFRPDGSGCRWLGALGHVNGLKYSFILPGGAEQMSCTLIVDPRYRTDAMDPGRIVRVRRGASWVWNGKLDEIVPGKGGIGMSAQGTGVLGGDYQAGWTTWSLNEPVNNAITRGLPWVNPSIPAGWLPTTPPDQFSSSITDDMNLISTQAGMTWYVGRNNVLSTGLLPTTPNRLLVCTVPVPRTIVADINALYVKYTVSDDANGTTVYNWALAVNQSSINKHGRMESSIDITAAGVMSGSSAAAIGQLVLNNYVRANYAGSFSAGYGQLMTLGGSPIDPGTDQAGTVCRLLMLDAGYGGEVVPGPINLLTGHYEYDDDAGLATLTPFQSFKTDLGSLLADLVPALR